MLLVSGFDHLTAMEEEGLAIVHVEKIVPPSKLQKADLNQEILLAEIS